MLLSLTLCSERWRGTQGPHGCRGGNMGSNPGLSGSRAKAPFSMQGCSPQRFPGQHLDLLIKNARYNYLLEIIPVCPILSVSCWSEFWDGPMSAEEQQSTVSMAPSGDFQRVASLRDRTARWRGTAGAELPVQWAEPWAFPPSSSHIMKGLTVSDYSQQYYLRRKGRREGREVICSHIVCVCVHVYVLAFKQWPFFQKYSKASLDLFLSLQNNQLDSPINYCAVAH